MALNYTTKVAFKESTETKIKNEKEFIEKFDNIFNQEIFERIKKAQPMNLFTKYGISFGEQGDIWFIEVKEKGKNVLKIKTINNGITY